MQVTSSQARLKELLDIYGDTQSDMVKKTGIEKSAISNYINGKREARQDKLILIANAYNVNPAWLMGLDVPMKSEVTMDKHTADSTARAMAYYEKFINAKPEVQAMIEYLLKSSQPKS